MMKSDNPSPLKSPMAEIEAPKLLYMTPLIEKPEPEESDDTFNDLGCSEPNTT